MRNSRVYPLIMTFVFIAALVFALFILIPKQELSVMTFAEIESLDLRDKYPQNPYALISAYNKILLGLYSANLTEEELKESVSLQRQLFAKDLLELNSYEVQLLETEEELALFEQSNNFMREISIENMNYDDTDEEICYVETKQSISNGQTLMFAYCLIVEENEWKILSWDSSAESEE